MRTPNGRADLPEGLVTFVFTDIEGSTSIVRRIGDEAFGRLLEEHNSLIRAVLDDHGGIEVATEGDSMFMVFPDPGDAITAARDIQVAFAGRISAGREALKVRIGMHTGRGVLAADNYVGVDVHRAQRIASAANGGQVLLSSDTEAWVGDVPSTDLSVRALGKFRLAGFDRAETLFELSIPGLPPVTSPPRGTRELSRVPEPLSALLGRDREMEKVLGFLPAHRLLTLTGPGGTGKTRFAIEVGRQMIGSFGDGVFFVPLGSVGDPDLVASSILGVLGLTTAPGVTPGEHLLGHLADREVLLILDNLEHLTGARPLILELLDACPDLTVMATSRIPLRVQGEFEFPLEPLGVPEVGVDELAPSVALFAERAAAVRPGFELTPENVDAVAAIARSVDGLPLAIELAASRTRSLTPQAILERLSNRLLSSPTDQGLGVPERQRSMVGAIGWSYDNLEEGPRQLFEELSVFSGSFGLDEAEAVSALPDVDVVDFLAALVESSLLRQTEESGSPRYRMLTVIREFGYGALTARDADEAAQRRHAEAYLALADAAAGEILTSRQGGWLERLDLDQDNVRAAFDFSVRTDDATVALALAGSLWRYWQIRGRLVEGLERVELALATCERPDPRRRARALTALAGLLYWQGKGEETILPYREALAIYREVGDQDEIAEALYNLSFPLGYLGEIEEAESVLEESLELARASGGAVGVGRAVWGLGHLASLTKSWEELVEYSWEAIEQFSKTDAPFDLGWSWFMLAHGLQRMDRSEESVPHIGEALAIFARTNDLSALTLIFEMAALVRYRKGEAVVAARLLGAAHRLKADTGVTIADVEANQYDELAELMESEDESVRAAYSEGLGYSAGEGIALASDGTVAGI